MPLQLISGPVVEPVSLLEAKAHLRVDISDDDALISALIVAARMHAETVTRRALIAQSWKLVLDSFPGPTLIGIPWGKPFTLPGHAIILEKSQVRVVTAIQYLDMSGVIQVMPAANYTVDLTSEPCRITPVFGQIWPIPMPQIGAVEVDFSAGYAEPFVADAANGTLSIQGPWFPTQPFVLSNSGGALPSPLQPATNYWIVSMPVPDWFGLSATPGGPAITLTDTGSGTNLVGTVPEGIRAWIKIRVGSLYQHREEMAAFDKTGKVMPLPFMDRLLDPYMVVF
ncbi:MAG: phage head-tail connector protein [Ferrovum myxofaciens]|uniref:head-tail connector protein n=1 Tax=Ferrovum myxofaciens TaxID=416213 RepID=UPI002352E206|nr:head-tail connector protein [Ferrovum myxofaciens]QKE40358.1 MAG: phage head-tail connector protein [Ferrovum myxofaciens]